MIQEIKQMGQKLVKVKLLVNLNIIPSIFGNKVKTD